MGTENPDLTRRIIVAHPVVARPVVVHPAVVEAHPVTVAVSPALVKPANPVATAELARQPIALAPVRIPIIPNAPLVTNINAPFFDDRRDGNKKWYLPQFALKVPLLDNFTLRCRQSGVDSQARPTYNGEATLVVSKCKPDALTQSSGSFTYQEVPLIGLNMSFVVTLFDKSTLAYPAQLTQNGSDYRLTINLETQEGLVRFYKFIADPANKKYCTISVTGGFFGYVPRPTSPQIDLYRAAFLDSHLQAMRVSPQVVRTPAAAAIMLNRIDVGQPTAIPRAPVPPPPIPNAVQTQDYDSRVTFPFRRAIAQISYDCHTFPDNYLVESSDGGTVTAFGCRPPFGDASTSRSTYSLLNLTKGSLRDRNYGIKQIYRNTYNGNFLVIPERYVVALESTEDEQLLTPSAYLFTSIDLNDVNGVNNSTASFQFNIVPDVSDYQLLLLKKLIADNLPASLNKTLSNVYIDFPEKVHDSAIVFDAVRIPTVVLNPIGAYHNGVAGSKQFHLQFQNVSIGNGHAEWIAKQLKIAGGGLYGNVTFEVDSESDAAPQSVIELSLARVSGNGLALQTNGDNELCLTNRTLYDITVDAYQTAKDPEQTFATVARVPANNIISAKALGLAGDLSQALLHYTFHANPNYTNQVLNEIRVVNLDTISDDIIVTNNTGLFSQYKIAGIDFVISLIRPGETDATKALATVSKALTVDGAINHIPFALPVAQYLGKRSAVYSTVVNFLDGTRQLNDVQLIEDLNSIGKLINLTFSRLNLHKS
jgi:hypothetical protein